MPINHPDIAPVSADPSGAPLSTDAWNADHSVPTLAEVLVAGNDPDGTVIEGAADSGNFGAFASIQAAAPTIGGNGYFGGGDGTGTGVGGDGILYGGGAAGQAYTFIQAIGAQPGVVNGRLVISIGGNIGNEGEVLTSGGVVDDWQPLLTSGSGAPGSSFVSLLYLDTSGLGAGDLYAWNGSSYTIVSVGA